MRQFAPLQPNQDHIYVKLQLTLAFSPLSQAVAPALGNLPVQGLSSGEG